MYLLPLGADRKIFGGEVARKSVRKSSMQRLLRCYDQRFAHDRNFLFYNFSQEMRHDASREVARVKDSEHMQRFKVILNEPDFEQRLRYAIKHPGSDIEKETV